MSTHASNVREFARAARIALAFCEHEIAKLHALRARAVTSATERGESVADATRGIDRDIDRLTGNAAKYRQAIPA